MTTKPAEPMRESFTIAQAAAFAGVTVPMVWNYLEQGLLGEPEHDDAGGLRYGTAAVLRLVQVRALAGAGVPPAEIGALLDYLAQVELVLNAEHRNGMR